MAVADMTELGDYIRTRREELNLSLADVSKMAGTTKSNISLLERGESGNPKVETLDGLARALRTPLDTLVRLALRRELSRTDLEQDLAARLESLPLSDRLEMLTLLDAMVAAKLRRPGR